MAEGSTISIPKDPGAVSADPKPAVVAATPADPNRPAWLPEKFKTPEDFAKSYGELEKKLGAPKAPEASKPAEAAKPVDSLAVTPKAADPEAAAEKAVTDAGLDWSALTNEFDTQGKLSDESYAALEKAKIPRGLADDFIEGQKARGEMVRTQVAAEIGGEDVIKEVLGWMADAASTGTISELELAEYNTAVTGRDKAKALAAVRSMHGRYISENGQKPNLVRGGAVAAVDVYESMQQLARDTRSELYKTDPAEQRRVDAKLARSKI